MAEDDWKKRKMEIERERQREDERDARAGKSNPSTGKGASSASSEKLDDLIQKADSLIEQVNNLYGMYVAGVERAAPIERRKQLEQVMLSLQSTMKNSPAALFRYNGVLAKYSSHKDKWERLLKDIESGKVVIRKPGKH